MKSSAIAVNFALGIILHGVGVILILKNFFFLN